MDKKELLNFLLKARTKTYAGDGGSVTPALKGSKQLEYKEENWLYRDVYYFGKGIFTGLEAIYYQDKPVWSMSYYGNFKKMTEEEIDKILRKALRENSKTARTWKLVKWQKDGYEYVCRSDFGKSVDDFGGSEKVSKSGKDVYSFFYAAGLIV
ncbi:MAG: hypothetical protein HYV47_03970 [Candidatus Nealsonbacteria bacterium]|nr:hypothetical protein [Candidatus Nealsonbacteria bacterium]